MPGGGLASDANRWIACRPGFFLPVRVLSRLFRRLFLQYLRAAFEAGQLQFFATLEPLGNPNTFAQYLRPLGQTKWVVYGLAVLCTVIVVGVVLLIVPALSSPSSLYPSLALVVAGDFLLLLIPLSFGFAMLRSRLWEIDIIINRSLVYGTLTAILALVYVGLIFGLQYVLRGMISQNNDVAIVVSTLAIAALFQPLRHRIQQIIDRRFYRPRCCRQNTKPDAHIRTVARYRTHTGLCGGRCNGIAPFF